MQVLAMLHGFSVQCDSCQHHTFWFPVYGVHRRSDITLQAQEHILHCASIRSWYDTCMHVRPCRGVQAYEGLQTAHKLKQEYVFLPAKLKEVYLTYLLEHLEDHKVCHPQYSPDRVLIHEAFICLFVRSRLPSKLAPLCFLQASLF